MDPKCECGGTYRRVNVERYDFTGVAGLPAELRDAPVLWCDACGQTALEGAVIRAALLALTQQILMLPRILTPAEVKYLRKGSLCQRSFSATTSLRRRRLRPFASAHGTTPVSSRWVRYSSRSPSGSIQGCGRWDRREV